MPIVPFFARRISFFAGATLLESCSCKSKGIYSKPPLSE